MPTSASRAALDNRQVATVTDPSPPVLGNMATATADELYELYHVQGKTLEWMADKYGCSTETVARALAKHGILRRGRGTRRPQLPVDVIGHILQRYRSGGTVPDIADELDIPRTWVEAEVVKAGIERPRRAVGDTDITPQQLRREYEAGASVADLVYAHDLKRSSVLTALHRAGTNMRPPPVPSTPRCTSFGDAACIPEGERSSGEGR